MNASRQTIWLGAAVALGLLASISPAAEPLHHASHLHHALHELKLARHELKESRHDFGGHKATALDATDDAIRHLEKLIGHPHYKHHLEGRTSHANEHDRHASHIHHALHALREAKLELKESKHDFGGQKTIALKDMEIAIHQLEHVVKHHRK